MIHIVIPVFNRWQFTKACLQSLQQQTYSDFKIVVVDHGSIDGTSEKIAEQFPDVVILKGDESMWWAAATNLGVKYALEISKSNEDFVLTLNNDLEVGENYFEELLNIYHITKPSLVGSTSVDFDRQEKICFVGITWNKYTAKQRVLPITYTKYSIVKNNIEYTQSDLLQGRGTLIPIVLFQEIGIYDAINFPHYGADEDFSLRCKNKDYALVVAVKALVKSHVTATGTNFVYQKQNFTQFIKSFNLKNSPNNLRIRYKWAKKHTPFPLSYFVIDMSRVFFSYLKKTILRK